MAKTSTAPKRRSNGLHARQIAEMQKLSPRAAAWLADVPASTLRDAAATLPPDEDGNFDARDIVNWVKARRLSQVQDDDLELIFRACEYYNSGGEFFPVRRVIQDMRSKYGRGVDGWFLDALLEYLNLECMDHMEPEAAKLPELTDTELLARAKKSYGAEQKRRAAIRFDEAVVCDECGKLRKGNKWVKVKLRPNESVTRGLCISCYSDGRSEPFAVDIRDLID